MKQIYYCGTPSCQRIGSSKRVFDDFTGQTCDWAEHPIEKTYDYIDINQLSETEIYNIILDNNLLNELSSEGLDKFYAYENPSKQY